jgi:hypothetical protein
MSVRAFGACPRSYHCVARHAANSTADTPDGRLLSGAEENAWGGAGRRRAYPLRRSVAARRWRDGDTKPITSGGTWCSPSAQITARGSASDATRFGGHESRDVGGLDSSESSMSRGDVGHVQWRKRVAGTGRGAARRTSQREGKE